MCTLCTHYVHTTSHIFEFAEVRTYVSSKYNVGLFSPNIFEQVDRRSKSATISGSKGLFSQTYTHFFPPFLIGDQSRRPPRNQRAVCRYQEHQRRRVGRGGRESPARRRRSLPRSQGCGAGKGQQSRDCDFLWRQLLGVGNHLSACRRSTSPKP